LCDEDEFLRRPLDTVPEIALSDLSRNLLDLLRGLGALLPEQAMPVSVDDWLQQPWLLSPPRERLEAALRILQQSRALDGMGHITATGRQLAELPVTVRLGCIAVAASQRYRNGTLGQDILHATLVLCALLSEGDLQPRAAASRGDAQDTDEHDNALERQYVLFCRLAGGQQPNSADLARRLARLQETLRSLWRGCGLVGAESWTLKDLVAVLPTELPLESCAAVFFAGYADAVALASGPGLLMHMTGESYVAPCVTQPGWHLVLEGVRLQSAGRKGSQTHKLASKVLPLDPVHLLDGPEEWLCEAQEVEAPKGAAPGLVRVRQVLRYGQLIMDQQQLKVDDSGFAKALSAWLLREHMARVMSCDAMVQLGKRLAVARPLLPEAAATSEGSLDPEALAQRLAVFLCSERGHAATSVSVDWDELTQEGCCARWALEPGVLAVLNRAAPSRLRLDNGIVVAVDYTGEQPTLVGKIQEFFGLVRHPQVSTAITKPTIQLQAPGGQTAQITADLVAFWTSSYPAVKKAYLGRYPKHHWPDDPAQAKPFLTKRQATLGIIRSGS
jgi:ATP-dependent helicase HrpB